VLAKAHEENGGEYRVKPILDACGVSMATYKRAHTSLVFAVEKLRSDHPKLARLTLTEVVAENIRRNLWPEFKSFFTGEMPVNTFRENFYLGSEQAKQEKNKQKTYKDARVPQEVAS